MPDSPSIQNYHIGKGICEFQEDGAPDLVDLGNAPNFEWAPKIEKKEHFSSREGVLTKDFTAITKAGATIKITLDEINRQNIAIFTLGQLGTDVDGNTTISALKKTEVAGLIKVTGTNDIGQKVDYTGRISVVPTGSFKFITDKDDFSVLEIEAEVQRDATGQFGIFTIHDVLPSPPSP